jgi:hypothetical protein
MRQPGAVEPSSLRAQRPYACRDLAWGWGGPGGLQRGRGGGDAEHGPPVR